MPSKPGPCTTSVSGRFKLVTACLSMIPLEEDLAHQKGSSCLNAGRVAGNSAHTKTPELAECFQIATISSRNLSAIYGCGLSSGRAASCYPLFAAVWAYSYTTPVPPG